MKYCIRILVILIITTLFISLISCAKNSNQGIETLHKVKEIDDYTVLFYESAAGFAGDTVTTAYSGEKFLKIENYKKSDLPLTKENMFGRDIDMYYKTSQKIYVYDYDIDVYSYSLDDIYIGVSINDQTGQIVRYATKGVDYDRNYKSNVNPASGKEEFLSYVKNILWEYAGASTDDRQVRIVTEIISEDGSTELKDGFVNYFNDNPNFNAQYTFYFTGDIDGIARCDDMKITVTNVGEVCSFEARQLNEAYAPFVNAKIDREKIISAVEKAFSSITNYYSVRSYNITFQAIPKETELWVEATVEFEFQAGEEQIFTSGVKYVIKVAELTE
ncbi:MAG: hypothetical protein ACI3XR_07535 [Eubacteriales bacterium]